MQFGSWARTKDGIAPPPGAVDQWGVMASTWHSLREFEALRTVIQAGTTAAAGRRLGISQSATSRLIGQLEGRLGRTLFERRGGRLQPTAEAMRLNSELDAVFEALSRIDREPSAQAGRKELRIAAPPTLAHRLLQRRLPGFMEARPDVMLHVDVLMSDALAAAIVEGRIDLAVTDATIRHAGVTGEPFRQSRLVGAMAPDHPLAEKATLSPADLAGVSFIALTRRHSVRIEIDRVFAAAGIDLDIRAETATAVSAVELVRANVGVSLLNPFPISAWFDPGVIARPFLPMSQCRTSFLFAANRPVSEPARAFMRYLKMNIPADPWSDPL